MSSRLSVAASSAAMSASATRLALGQAFLFHAPAHRRQGL